VIIPCSVGTGAGTSGTVSFCHDQNRNWNRDLALGSGSGFGSGSDYKKSIKYDLIHYLVFKRIRVGEQNKKFQVKSTCLQTVLIEI
jgi:hypothetical protein